MDNEASSVPDHSTPISSEALLQLINSSIQSGNPLILRSANLSGANLSETTLIGADLCNADMPEVDMHHADLSGANLSRAKLVFADLSRFANLSKAE